MSSAPLPQPSKRDEYDSPAGLFSVISTVADLKKFFATRKAVLEGEALYLRTKAELSSQKFMGPWHFNTMQSVLCSIPGMTIGFIVGLFVSQKAVVESASGDPVQQKIFSVLSPLQAPFTLLLVVYAIAFCCLPSGYVSAINWRAAQRKYLYLDASYGIWPQFALATCIAIIPLGAVKNQFASLLALFAGLVLLGAALWQVLVTGNKIRQDLFEYDYLADRPQMFGMLEGRPFFKFYVVGAVAIPLAVLFLAAGLYEISFVLAGVIHQIHR